MGCGTLYMVKNDKTEEYEIDAETASFIWGDDGCAFVKSSVEDGETFWYVYSSDGEKIAKTASREQAFVVAKQNEYIPFSSH